MTGSPSNVPWPHANPIVSHWIADTPQTTKDAVLEHPNTTQPLPGRADIVIIGSGISGTGVAYHTLSRSSQRGGDTPQILMLEARGPCEAASGRNGGHSKAPFYRNFGENKDKHGLEEALRIAKLQAENGPQLRKVITDNGIDCDLTFCKTADVFFDAQAWENAKDAITRLRQDAPELGNLFKSNSAERTKDVYFTAGAKGSVTYDAASLNVYKCVLAMLHSCLERGMRLRINTCATRLEPANDGWLVSTSDGAVHCHKVVIATNGYASNLMHEVAGTIVPVRGQVSLQTPGPALPKLTSTYSTFRPQQFHYTMQTSKGGIVIGRGARHNGSGYHSDFWKADDTRLDPELTSYLQDAAMRDFESHWGHDDAHRRVQREWTGIMGFTPDGAPFVGPVPDKPGLFLLAGFNGLGMALCFKCAEAISCLLDRSGTAVYSSGTASQTSAELPWLPRSYAVTRERMAQKLPHARQELARL